MPNQPEINASLRRRIYWSFALLVTICIISVAFTNAKLQRTRKTSERVTREIDPALVNLVNFDRLLLESRAILLGSSFHKSSEATTRRWDTLYKRQYALIKNSLNGNLSSWTRRSWRDSLHSLFPKTDTLLARTNQLLQEPSPLAKVTSDSLQLSIFGLNNELYTLTESLRKTRYEESTALYKLSKEIQLFTLIAGIITILAGILVAIFIARMIARPISNMNSLIRDLGRGRIRKIDPSTVSTEMNDMVVAVNALADKLQHMASFAHETGLRNFDMPFSPMSEEDTLGKALLSMRENLKTSAHTLELKNKEMERKNKELEQFAFVASHDLQEPLRTTASFVDLLQKQYKGRLDEKADKYLDYVKLAADRMQTLITDLLEYSRIGNNQEVQDVDCNRVMADVLADLQMAIEETGAEIKTDDLPVVRGYATEMKQLFQNLTYNAIKFRKKDTSPTIYISVRKKNNAWEFGCTDNGIGIAREHNERIFIIFQRLHTRSEYKGSGIGLSHCKKIVELHKGKIWLESEPGRGTTFYFTIPLN